jgi:hypothetical protein
MSYYHNASVNKRPGCESPRNLSMPARIAASASSRIHAESGRRFLRAAKSVSFCLVRHCTSQGRRLYSFRNKRTSTSLSIAARPASGTTVSTFARNRAGETDCQSAGTRSAAPAVTGRPSLRRSLRARRRAQHSGSASLLDEINRRWDRRCRLDARKPFPSRASSEN